MLKLVAPRPPHAPRRQPRKRRNKGDGVRMLHRQIEEDRITGQSTQRAIARARRTVIEVHCCVQRSASCLARRDPPTAADHARLLADLASRLEDIHQRLLLFSANIELEIDRLDMIHAQLDVLTASSQVR